MFLQVASISVQSAYENQSVSHNDNRKILPFVYVYVTVVYISSIAFTIDENKNQIIVFHLQRQPVIQFSTATGCQKKKKNRLSCKTFLLDNEYNSKKTEMVVSLKEKKEEAIFRVLHKVTTF